MSEQSLGRVVHNIMESLSDAISGLILLVITLQEQNAAVPPNIISGSEGVCTTANNLAEIASEVANSEYEDYPELQGPILDAAKDVRTSGVALQQAVQNLSKSSDRAGAWTRHLEACRTISGQTVLILQLVYGAELKRLMMVSEALKDLAGNTSAELVSTPQKLADRASELATMASDLASFYAERAKDDPACRIAAEKLEKLSDEIPELANRLLADPKNEKLKKEFNDKIKELQKEIENAMAPVKDLIRMQPEVVMPKADVPKLPKTPLKMETVPKAVNEGTHGAKVHPTSDPVKAAERAKEIIIALTDAAQSKNVPSAVREATNLNNTVAPLLACLETLNQGSKDPERQKQLKSIADDVKAVLPVVLQAVEKELKEPTATPKGPSPVAKAAEEAKTVLSAVAQIAAPAPEVEKAAGTPDVRADIRKQMDEIALLDSAAALGEPKSIAARQKAIARREPQIDRALLALADDPFLNNPKAKTNLVKAVSKIDEILPAEIKAAEEVVKKPKDQEPKAKLGKSTKEHKLTLAEVAADLAGEGDLPTTSSPGNLMDKMKELVDALQSGKDDPDNDVLANLLNAMGPALEQLLDAATDEEQVAANEIAKMADDIVKMLDEMQETAEKNPAGIDALGDKIKRKTRELGALAGKVLPPYMTPEEKALFDAAMDDLSALLPEIVKAAHACGKNPKPKEKERLKNLVAAAQKNARYVRQIKPPVDAGPGPRLIKIKKGIRKLVDDGDGAPIEDFRKVLENLKKIIRDAIPPKVAKEKGPAYELPKKILEALSALEKKIDERQKKNPQDKSPAWKAFPEAKKFFQDLAKDPAPIIKPSPKEKLDQQIAEALPLLDRLVGAAPTAAKDPAKIVNVTKPLVQKLKDIIEDIKTTAAQEPNPDVKKKLLEVIPQLEQEIPPLVNIAKELVQKPDDDTALQNLNDIVARLKEPLIDVQKSIRPADPILEAKAAAAKEQTALQKLRRAATAKDPQALKNAMTNAKDAHDKFVKAAKTAAEKAPDAAKKDLNKDIDAVDLQFKKISPLVDGLAQNPTDANHEKLLDAIRDTETPLARAAENLEKIPEAQNDQAVELAKNIRAAIKERNNRKKFDPSHLLKASRELAGLLNDMVSHTRVEAQQQAGDASERAKAALQLDSMLLSLDKSATAAPGTGPVQSVDAALASLSSLSLNMPGGSSSGSSQPTALSKNIMQVVGDMKKKTSSSASLEGTAVHALTQGLAGDLAKFADADSGSKRSELIVLGRSVAANIVKLAEELTRLAGLCTDPKMKEKLLQNALILRNTATQLKIIASVRAASSQNNDTTTDQLSILTQNLGVIIAEATNTITIVKQTKRGL